MKTIFDDLDRADLIKRINTLTVSDKPAWGKMSVSQMIEHCIRMEEMMAGKRKVSRVFLGYIFGKMALKSMIGDDRPVKQGIPTFKELVIDDVDGSFEAQKEKWTDLLKGYQNISAEFFMHPFFGKITKEQAGRLAYKHTDHHLRQFER